MKPFLSLFIVLAFVSCATTSNWNCLQIAVGNMEYNEMVELFPRKHFIDTSLYKSVAIYDYTFKKNGTVKDSVLLVHQNLQSLVFELNAYITQRKIETETQGILAQSVKDRIKYFIGEKEYDANNNIVVWKTYTRSDEVYAKTLYTYDSITQFLLLEERFQHYPYDVPVLDKIREYEYDEGFLIKETAYSYDFKNKQIKIFDKKGQNVGYRSETFKNDTLAHFWGFRSFYHDSKRYKKEYYGSDRSHIVTNYRYDLHRMPIEVFSYNQLNTKPTYLVRYYYADEVIENEINPY